MAVSTKDAYLPDVVMPACGIERILNGQKALITGANSGTGKGIAQALGEAGADVVVNYYSGDEAAGEVVNEIQNQGSKAFAHKADVS